MTIEFLALGGFEVRLGGRPVQLGHARQQCVLAALLVDADQPVPVGRLVERVWGDQPPRRVDNALQAYVSRLRRTLGGDGRERVVRRAEGYLLAADRASVDLHRFGQLVDQARAAGDDERSRALFAQALALWRGEPFAALETRWLAALREGLNRQRFTAELDYAAARLRLGQHAQLLAELADRAAAHPLDERVCRHLMLALHRSGRTAEALSHYRSTRGRLADELGIEPGSQLRELHQQILRGDPTVPLPRTLVRTRSVVTRRPGPIPRQLPAGPPALIGRTAELDDLDRILPDGGDAAHGPQICVVTGAGGVGKTWLALHWAHRHAHRFPDGQLYVNLRGFGPAGAPVAPADALRGFLDAFDVAVDRIPAGLDERAALFRSILAGKRVLILLDNAGDAAQVRPLLPGSASCRVIVTSRQRYSGLVVADSAYALTLDLLDRADAHRLLRTAVGAPRLDAEPEATDEIIARCAGLPLALALAAARMAGAPHAPLAQFAAALRPPAAGLDPFESADSATDLRTVLNWSYRALSPEAAALFRALAVHPGADFGVHTAASIAHRSVLRCRRLLTELVDGHLLSSPGPDRFTMHELLQAYASELAGDHDGRRRRVLDHYLHTAVAVAQAMFPRDPIDVAPPLAGVVTEPIDGDGAAWAWFAANATTLLAAIDLAVAAGRITHAWQLVWCVRSYLLLQGWWPELITLQRRVLEVVRDDGDTIGQVRLLHGLTLTHLRLRQLDEAERCCAEALPLAAAAGDLVGQADIHICIGQIEEGRGRPRRGLVHADQSLTLYRRAGAAAGAANALNSVGWLHALLGDHHRAIELCTRAIDELRPHGHRYHEAATWDSLGYAYRGLGDHDQSGVCYRRAADLFTALDDRTCLADALTNLGDAHLAADRPEEARQTWMRALTVLEQRIHADTSHLHARLDSAS